MGFDMTMLAPGPAGTSMIGESNIDAAARRGRERLRREAEERKRAEDTEAQGRETGNEKDKDSGAQSGKTLIAQSNGECGGLQSKKDVTLSTTSTNVPDGASTNAPSAKEAGHEGKVRGTWERLQRKFRD